jgi:two-component system OmpR family response regulator
VQHGRILVVEDEPNVSELVALYLSREGYEVQVVEDGESALQQFATWRPDLVVLDLLLPRIDGWEVCRQIRGRSQTPIIMLTARTDDLDRILGLEMGADDYVSKPFNPRELVARVRAVLRRSRATPSTGLQAVIRLPELEIDRDRHSAHVAGEEVRLTPKEFDLLWLLASNPGRAFNRQELLEHVWGFDFFGDDRTIDVHVKRLRRKLEPETHPYRYIHTVWGVGYRLEALPVEETR